MDNDYFDIGYCFTTMVVTRSQSSTDSKAKNKIRHVHLVTGGGGFAGFHLGNRLAAHGHRVILLDVREPLWTMTKGMEFVQIYNIL